MNSRFATPSAGEPWAGGIRRNPSFTTARLRLGVVLKHQGHPEEALREWERCAEEDPRDLRVRAYIASVSEEAATTDAGVTEDD